MNHCVLHVGMPKTGTSSIQESLYFGLLNRGFQYLSFGEVTANRWMETLFGEHPEQAHYNRKIGLSEQAAAALQDAARRRLSRAVEQARFRQQTVIVSAETCWEMDPVELQRIRDFFNRQGFAVQVFVSLRPWKTWLESAFQEWVKQHAAVLEVLPESRAHLMDYPARLAVLDEVFGAERVVPYAFDPAGFPQGCAVLDFCARTGIPLAAHQVRRSNEGLSFAALKLLYAYRRWGGGYGVGLPAVIRNEILFRRLAELKGASIRFHSRLVEPFLAGWYDQRPALERRLGKDLWENPLKYDEGDCVSDETDLWCFSPESLAWLSQATGLPQIRGTEGEQVAQQVSRQMQHLSQHPSLGSRLRWHRMILSRRIAGWRRNV
ncbi:MAG: hypothetical protein ACK5EA_10910 [Planctomycetaceae bacterium]